MAKLIYSTIGSLDGYVADEDGRIRLGCSGRGGARLRQRPRAADRHLPLRPAHVRDHVGLADHGRRSRRVRRGARLRERLAGRRQDRLFDDADLAVHTAHPHRAQLCRRCRSRQLKAGATRDISIGGPTLAAHALRAGLVDECQFFLTPVVVGAGTPSLPPGLQLRLELLAQRTFGNGVVYLRYRCTN